MTKATLSRQHKQYYDSVQRELGNFTLVLIYGERELANYTESLMYRGKQTANLDINFIT